MSKKKEYAQQKEKERAFDPSTPTDQEDEIYSDNRLSWSDKPGLIEFAIAIGLDPERNYEDSRNGQVRSCFSMAIFLSVVSPEMRSISLAFHSPTKANPRPANRSWSSTG